MGIEPTSSVWKTEVLPLNYTRGCALLARTVCRSSGSGHYRFSILRPIYNSNEPVLVYPLPPPHSMVEGVGFEPTKA